MTQLKPCKQCGSNNIQYLACSYRVKCKDCGNKVTAQDRYLSHGIQPKEAAYRSWNEAN